MPAEVLSENVRFISSSDTGVRPSWLRTNIAIFSVSEKVATGPEGSTHFRLTYPRYRAGQDYFSQDDLVGLFDLFEDIFDMYQDVYGYKYASRTEYPVDVYIVPLGREGGTGCSRRVFSLNSATITLNSRLFYLGKDKVFDPAAGRLWRVPGVFAHEFFHFVQANYVSPGSSCLWSDEATATYHESLIRSGTLDHIDRMGTGSGPTTAFSLPRISLSTDMRACH